MLKNIRFYVLALAVMWAFTAYGWVAVTYPEGTIQTIRLTQIAALSSFFFLYLTLLVGPLCYVLPQIPYRKYILHARRALGFSAFYFAFLHSYLGFFTQLGGFEGLPFLSDRYLLAITLSFIALIMLSLFAVTSFDVLIKKYSFIKRKVMYGFLYAAAFLVLIHALMIGTHFSNLSDYIPQIFFSAFIVLLFLEALRADDFLQRKFKTVPKFGLLTTIVVGFIIFFYGYSLLPDKPEIGLSVHNQHVQLAKEAQQNTTNTVTTSTLPGMDGDKTKRYTTGFVSPDTVALNETVTLRFPIYDANSGNKVVYFKKFYEKPSHLIIVDSSLTYFTHIHPEPEGNEFVVTTEFPKSGVYHLYLNYQPLGGIEQQVAFTLSVGEGEIVKPIAEVDQELTKQFGEYQVSIAYPQPLQSSQLSIGRQQFTFTIKNAAGEPVTTLKPYLAAFGHLVMINQDTYEYIHAHPTNTLPPEPDENGGPDVSFMPLGLYGPIKPGIYKVYGQFNPDGNLFVADFTVVVN